MYAQVEKSKENKSRAVANSVAQKKSNTKQGLGFVNNRPEAVVQRKLSNVSGHVLQLVKAYRAESSLENPKIETDNDGRYLNLSANAHSEGISMSFENDEHFQYYLSGRSLGITMDFNNGVYGNIKKMFNTESGSVDKAYKKISKPSPCSDPVMGTDLKGKIDPKQVLTFSKDWADIIEKAISNTQVEIVGDEEINDSDIVAADFGEEDYWEMSKEDAEEADLPWISLNKARKCGIQVKG